MRYFNFAGFFFVGWYNLSFARREPRKTKNIIKNNVEDTDSSFLFIVGNGTGSGDRHNAFAVTKSGELALFAENGTPVILDANTLKDIIALV